MSWDCRTVQIHVIVNVHDESRVNQDHLIGRVAREATDLVESYTRRLNEELANEGAEVYVS